MLDEKILRSLTDGCGARIVVLPEVGSTNDELKRMAADGAPQGTVVLTDSQTAGKGRLGRSFFSPRSGVYMSLLLRPESAPEQTLFYTVAAANAVCRAVEKIGGGSARIKWVNDVYLGAKKICGILAEGSLSNGSTDWVVLGIGTNILPPEGGFPQEIAWRAGAVFDGGEVPENISERYAAELIAQLSALCFGGSMSSVIDEYRARSLMIGREITAVMPSGERLCRAVAITDDAGLEVEYPDGGREVLRTGEVSVRL